MGTRVRKSRYRRRVLRTAAISLSAILLLATILLNLFTHVLAVVRYYGDGMEPTLSGGQYLVLLRTQDVEQNDVVAFYYNNKLLVRRIIGEGGQQISISRNGTVSLNNQPLDEPYLLAPSFGQCNLTFPFYIPPNEFFVLGDNRAISMDSRLAEIGTIPSERILGKLLFAF